MSNWAKKAIFYHIYPLGFCGTPFENTYEEQSINRIQKVIDWIPHLKDLGIDAIYFGPLFEAKTHGYDTTDYTKLDSRLGSNEEFKDVCKALHKAEIRVVVDGVFNHVGRDFFAFKDVQQNGAASKYKEWFENINFGGHSPLGDSFYYDAWEGHFELVKLNLHNLEVKDYLFKAIAGWIDDFDIDGIRLDVAYCLDRDFLGELRQFVDSKKTDFWLMGEMIHGDYRGLVQPGLLDSATNYECYKGIYSSHNDKNYFEINHSLNRLFGQGGLYQRLDLYSFVDNHDVTRIATILKEKKHIDNVYALLFTMPGIPSIYYGSEWQVGGSKEQSSDQSLRPSLELQEMHTRDQRLVHYINELATIRKRYKVFTEGRYEQIIVRNEQLLFARITDTERVYVALNLADSMVTLRMKGNPEESLTNILGKREKIPFEHNEYVVELPPFTAKIMVAQVSIVKDLMEVVEIPEEIEGGKVIQSEVKDINHRKLKDEEGGEVKKVGFKEKVMKRIFSR